MNLIKWKLAGALCFIMHISWGQVITNYSDLKINLMGGPSFSNYFGKDISGNIPIIRYYAGARIGYFFASALEIETGYGFNMLGTNENNKYLKITHTATYHQIPLLLKLKISKVTLGTGSELNLLQNALVTSENSTIIDNPEVAYKKYFWSWITDLTYDVDDRNAIGFNLSYGLQPVLKDDFDWKAGAFRIVYIMHLY
jgi:hypothetical protein